MIPETIGRYLIREEMGRGGMATVFRAFDPRFKREVAIKVLPRQFMHDPTFRARFEREAQTIAALEHPAIVPVYDFGEDDEMPYLVMRLMSGGTLAERLHFGPLPLPQIASLLGWLAPGLDEAHRQGIIHRDLKPSNILFDQWDKAYLSDFGIVKLVEGSGGTLTDASTALGTPAYMSPEQVLGNGKLDWRSDIYAFGVILFEMLTGKKPYVADTPMGQALKHVTDVIPHVQQFNPVLPPECQLVVARAMDKDREKRYQTATEVAAAFLPIAGITPASEILVWSEVKTPSTPLPSPAPAAYNPDEATVSEFLVSSSESLLSRGELSEPEKPLAKGGEPSPLYTPHSPNAPLPPSTAPPTQVIGRGVKPVVILPPDPARGQTPTPQVTPQPAAAALSLPPRRSPWRLIGGVIMVALLLIAGVALLRNGRDEVPTPTFSAILQPPPTLIIPLETRTTPTLTPAAAAATPTAEPVPTPTARPPLTLPTDPITPDNVTQVGEITYWGRGIPNEAAFSPQGDRLALAATDGLFIYAITDGQVQPEPLLAIDPGTVINTLAYSPDGTLIATGDTDRLVRLWDAATGEEKQQLTGHSNWVRSVAFSPDGHYLASGATDALIYLWSLQDGAAASGQELSGFNDVVWGVAFSPDSQTLAAALNDNTIQLVDVADPENRRVLTGHSGRVFAVTFSPDGQYLASASADGTARLWYVPTGETTAIFEGHVGWVRAIAFMPDGLQLVTASYDSTARLWGSMNESAAITLFGHLGLVVHTAVSPDGSLIVTVSADGTVRLWQGGDGAAQGILADGTGRVLAVAVDGAGQFAAAGTYDGSVRLWQLESGALHHLLEGHQNWVRAVAFSPDGRWLASGSDDRTVRLWDTATGASLARLTGHSSRIRWLSFAATGDRLLVGLGDGSAWVWSMGSGEPSGTQLLPPQPENALSIAFSPDGTLIAAGSEAGQVRVWQANDGSLRYDLVGHSDRVNALIFSPDGAWLLSGSTDGTVYFWQMSDGQPRAVWNSPGGPLPVHGIAFSPDGRLLVVTTAQGHLWWVDPLTAETRHSQKGHTDLVRGLAFTPANYLLLSGSDDGTIVLWGVQVNEE